MNKKPSYRRTYLLGVLLGAFGSILGFFPVTFLKISLWNLFGHLSGSMDKIPRFLVYFAFGMPLPFQLIVYLPLCGAILGLIGAFIGLRRRSPRLWLWAALAGFLFNLFVFFVSL